MICLFHFLATVCVLYIGDNLLLLDRKFGHFAEKDSRSIDKRSSFNASDLYDSYRHLFFP